MEKKKIAFVLTGEGAKGAFQALALYELARQKIYPDLLVGVSSGAMNAVGYSVLGPSALISFWEKIKSMRDVFSFNWKFLWQSGFFTAKPLKKKVSTLLNKRYKIPVFYPIANAKFGNVIWAAAKQNDEFKSEDVNCLIEAVTIPGLVATDSGMIDGGAIILCPLKIAIEQGADEIYVIAGRSIAVPTQFVPPKIIPAGGYAYRFLDLLMHYNIYNDIDKAIQYNQRDDKKKIKITLVEPSRPLGDALDFKQVPKVLSDSVLEAKFTELT